MKWRCLVCWIEFECGCEPKGGILLNRDPQYCAHQWELVDAQKPDDEKVVQKAEIPCFSRSQKA